MNGVAHLQYLQRRKVSEMSLEEMRDLLQEDLDQADRDLKILKEKRYVLFAALRSFRRYISLCEASHEGRSSK